MSLTINTANEGTYVVNYKCTDDAGNTVNKERNIYITRKVVNYFSSNSSMPGAFEHIVFFPNEQHYYQFPHQHPINTNFEPNQILLTARNATLKIVPLIHVWNNVNPFALGIYSCRFHAVVNVPGGLTYRDEIDVRVEVVDEGGIGDPPPIHRPPPGDIEP